MTGGERTLEVDAASENDALLLAKASRIYALSVKEVSEDSEVSAEQIRSAPMRLNIAIPAVGLFVSVVFVVAYINDWKFGVSATPEAPSALQVQSSSGPVRSPGNATSNQLDEIEKRFVKKIDTGNSDYSDITRDLVPIQKEVRERVEQINRKPHEQGYSIEVRREAAYRTLVRQGYTPTEARLTVAAMEERGLLPDPSAN